MVSKGVRGSVGERGSESELQIVRWVVVGECGADELGGLMVGRG